MQDPRFTLCAQLIDRQNAADPSRLEVDGKELPQALVEGQRAAGWLLRVYPQASAPLQLAAQAHHLRRWEVPRDSYPLTREGYHAWRRALYRWHADALAELMRAAGFSNDEIAAARRPMLREHIKTDPEAQAYEDAVSLAFLEVRLTTFAPSLEEEQLERALRRTWLKMSEAGREAAHTLPLAPEVLAMLDALVTV